MKKGIINKISVGANVVRPLYKGITLISLVITIVIMIILAGVGIYGSLALIEEAKYAAYANEMKQIEEAFAMYILEKQLEAAEAEEKIEVFEELINVNTEELPQNLKREINYIREKLAGTVDITAELPSDCSDIVETGEGKNIYYLSSELTDGKEEAYIYDEQSASVYKIEPTIIWGVEMHGYEYGNLLATQSGLLERAQNKVSPDTIVTEEVSSIAINKTSTVIAVGKTEELIVTIEPESLSNTEVKWSSSNEDIATVDANGVVTGKAEGKVEITVETQDTSKKTATCTVLIGTLVTTVTTVEHETMSTIDRMGNRVTLPGGFKIASDSGSTVQSGIVVEDASGNQFVWIPVSNINHDGSNKIVLDDGSEVEITLGRYAFDTTTGTETKVQYGSEYTATTLATVSAGTVTKYKKGNGYEVTDARDSNKLATTAGTNSTAKDLAGFVSSVSKNKGYYLARYEASYSSGSKLGLGDSSTYYKIASKESTAYTTSGEMSFKAGTLWNWVTQGTASTVSKQMYYGDSYVESDLVNSYAWDTAIVYIQKMGNSNYANANCETTGNTSLKNTGTIGDEKCKIFDMASNAREWTTEYSIGVADSGVLLPCIYRGGRFRGTATDGTEYYTAYSGEYSAAKYLEGVSFRVMLYCK